MVYLHGFRDDYNILNLYTINKIVVMGYNTFKSLPGDKPIIAIKDRLNVVITNNHYDELVNKISNRRLENLDILVYKTFDGFYKIYQKII